MQQPPEKHSPENHSGGEHTGRAVAFCLSEIAGPETVDADASGRAWFTVSVTPAAGLPQVSTCGEACPEDARDGELAAYRLMAETVTRISLQAALIEDCSEDELRRVLAESIADHLGLSRAKIVAEPETGEPRTPRVAGRGPGASLQAIAGAVLARLDGPRWPESN